MKHNKGRLNFDPGPGDDDDDEEGEETSDDDDAEGRIKFPDLSKGVKSSADGPPEKVVSKG